MTIDRFHLAEETFVHGDVRLRLLRPRAAEELIDEAAFVADERIPYWAELWPSARALARELIDRDLRPERTIELGCGLGLPTLVLAARGAGVLATDYYPEALEFVSENATRNGVAVPELRLLDWRDPPPDVSSFPVILAADLLYEARNVEALARVLRHVAAPEARLFIADPGRSHLETFGRAARDDGWRPVEVMTREEPNAPGPKVKVLITEWRRDVASSVSPSRRSP